ncbi:hypothetical protein N8I71_04760 [Roseibacterium sp. SDUM158016]|jgi:hypothetical protein|uniref:hypothetical protein n=1 Tax=Roseicyclus sediminis TaxID=2980997 RepID=UPI0021D17A47|nr:hypothetical protein [Roseibacterium sp. SDUM158016]MCU4652128.1 hypothetical protein [Roseibacterium sp. SDUM158016]
MGHRLCRIAVILVALLYLAALFLFFVGAFGWFGQERTPLAGVFLVPLGLPWNLWLDGLAETVRPWLAALTPLLNIAILAALCTWLRPSKLT